MILAQLVMPAALTFNELRRWRQEGPVQVRLTLQYFQKTHPGSGLGLVCLGEVRAVDHPMPRRQQQAAGPTHHQQAPDPGPLDRLDDGVWLDGREMRRAQHRIHTCDRRLHGRAVLGIQRLDGNPVPPLQPRRVAGDGQHTVATAQGLLQQLAASAASGTDDCNLAHGILSIN